MALGEPGQKRYPFAKGEPTTVSQASTMEAKADHSLEIIDVDGALAQDSTFQLSETPNSELPDGSEIQLLATADGTGRTLSFGNHIDATSVSLGANETHLITLVKRGSVYKKKSAAQVS
jgi:hypothetical protein